MMDENIWMKSRHHGINRRSLLRKAGAGSAGLAAATLIGCSSSDKPATPSDSTVATIQPKRGGILVHSGGENGSYDSRGTTLDPHINSALGASTYRHFYQGLVAYDLLTYEVVPEIAQKWEQRSENEYVFTLQPGVKWQNKPPAGGRLLSANDVVFSLNRARTNEPRFTGRSLLTNIDKIEAVDNATVRVTTKGPDAATLSNLSADILLILAPEAVEKANRFTTAEEVVGTGPFIMTTVEQDVGADYVRNPDYWKPNLPYLDGLRTRSFDDQRAFAALQANQLDVIRMIGTESKKWIEQQGPGFNPLWFNDDTCLMLQPNTKAKPFDDARVTRALRLLLDHEEYISAWADTWFGRGRYGSLFATALEPWDFTHDEYRSKFLEWKSPKDDAVREAVSLLGAAGFNRGSPLRFEVANQGVPAGTFSEAFPLLAIAQWQRLGQGVLDPQNRPYDLATSNTIRGNRSFSVFMGGNAGAIPEPDAWLSAIYRTGASRNYMNFSDPKFDEMIDRQRTIFNIQQRKAAVKDIITYSIDNVPGVIPTNRFFLTAGRPHVRDLMPEFFMKGWQYEWVWLDT